MAYFTYDTSVMVSGRPLELDIRAKGLLLSSVVLLELMASEKDDAGLKVYENLFLKCERDNTLIVPNEIDWASS